MTERPSICRSGPPKNGESVRWTTFMVFAMRWWVRRRQASAPLRHSSYRPPNRGRSLARALIAETVGHRVVVAQRMWRRTHALAQPRPAPSLWENGEKRAPDRAAAAGASTIHAPRSGYERCQCHGFRWVRTHPLADARNPFLDSRCRDRLVLRRLSVRCRCASPPSAAADRVIGAARAAHGHRGRRGAQ